MLIPGIIIIFIFHYVPLGGLIIAFQRFIPAKGLFGNQKWVGLQNFQYIFSMPNTMNVLRNTVTIAVAKIVLGLVIPITVALMLNELQHPTKAQAHHPDRHLLPALSQLDHFRLHRDGSAQPAERHRQ